MQKQDAQINRRKFISSIGLIGAVTSLNPLQVLAEKQHLSEEASGNMKCKPYLQAPGIDSITVHWVTHFPCHSWVEYGEGPKTLNRRAEQTEEGMVQVDNTIHAVKLSGLLPGKTYYYRAVSRKTLSMERKQQAFGEPAYSPVYSFTTFSDHAETAEFVVFNDIHDRPESFEALMKYKRGNKTDFVFLNGDMFDRLEDEGQILNHLINPLTDLFAATTPFFLGRGNHETHGGYARQLSGYFDGKKDNKYYYSFQHGPMYALVMDSGETKSDEDPVNGGIVNFDAYREKQAAWLAEEVKKEAFKKAEYRIVFVHIPPHYTANPLHAAEHYKKLWGQVFNTSKIDLMLCGHTHKYGIHPAVPRLHNYPIVIGGGPKDGRRTIINIKITKQALDLQMIDDSGKQVGSLSL